MSCIRFFFPGQRSKKKPAYICHWLYQFSKWFNCTFFLFWVFFCFVLFCFFVTFFDYRIMTKTSKNSGRPFMDLTYMLMLEDQNALNLNCPAVGWNTHPAWKKGRDRPSSLKQVMTIPLPNSRKTLKCTGCSMSQLDGHVPWA